MPLFKTTDDVDAADLQLIFGRSPQPYLDWCILTDRQGELMNGETPEEYAAQRVRLANHHFKAGDISFGLKGHCPDIDLTDYILDFDGAEMLPEDVPTLSGGSVEPFIVSWQRTTRDMSPPERRALWEVIRVLLT